MPHFECGPFDHSGISPLRGVLLCLCHAPEGGGGGRGAIPFEAQSYCNLFIPTSIGAKKRPLGRVFLFSGADGLCSLSRGFLSFCQMSQAFRADYFFYSDRGLRLSERSTFPILTDVLGFPSGGLCPFWQKNSAFFSPCRSWQEECFGWLPLSSCPSALSGRWRAGQKGSGHAEAQRLAAWPLL